MKVSFVLNIVLSLSLFFSLSSCQENSKDVLPKNQVNIQIDGMMCENACGAKIKKELLEISGVENVVVNFVGIDANNSVNVTFQPEKCSLGDMTKKIEKIGGGTLYKVKSINTETR